MCAPGTAGPCCHPPRCRRVPRPRRDGQEVSHGAWRHPRHGRGSIPSLAFHARGPHRPRTPPPHPRPAPTTPPPRPQNPPAAGPRTPPAHQPRTGAPQAPPGQDPPGSAPQPTPAPAAPPPSHPAEPAAPPPTPPGTQPGTHPGTTPAGTPTPQHIRQQIHHRGHDPHRAISSRARSVNSHPQAWLSTAVPLMHAVIGTVTCAASACIDPHRAVAVTLTCWALPPVRS